MLGFTLLERTTTGKRHQKQCKVRGQGPALFSWLAFEGSSVLADRFPESLPFGTLNTLGIISLSLWTGAYNVPTGRVSCFIVGSEL